MVSSRRLQRATHKPFFALMGWNTETPSDLKLLRRVRDCGLNIAGMGPAEALDNCQKAGVKLIVQDPVFFQHDWKTFDHDRVRDQVTRAVKRLRKHPAVYGYYLMDEPPASYFPGLAKMVELIRSVDPDHFPYINLLPNYANAQQLGTATYPEHVEAFINTCKPTIVTYDNYFLTRYNPADADLYWLNLHQLASICRPRGITFWNIVSSVGSFSYRVPTDADLRLQAFSSLAYGAGGICYFTYFAPPHGNYRLCPVDQFLQETPTWYHLQNVNLQIQKLLPTLAQLQWQRAYHLGPVPPSCPAPDEQSLIQASPNGPVVVGEFRSAQGIPYVLVVYYGMAESMYCEFKLRAGVKIEAIVSAWTGVEDLYHGHQAFLAPGQGALLRMSERPIDA